MLLCVVVGLLLLVVGASTLTRPAAPVAAQVRPDAPTTSAPGPAPPGAAPSAGAGPTATADPSRKVVEGRLDGVFVADRGPGSYAGADVSVPTSADSGRLYRVDVRVEDGLGLDPDVVARAIGRTLDDPRSWRSTGRARFSVVPLGQRADLHAYVVTPGTTDRLCAPLLTRGEVSCRAGDKVVLNAKRWVLGADAYGSDVDEVAAYREYLVNHEFGHALGRSHVGCPARGRPAPVMLQQTKGLQGCTANPWPSVTRG
ncbi:Protein of unknown function [Microlunatus sagamiharensis]|uniref:DUF3152 domain-containing protein n=1 Tax=Microlunatus sagamiharensis TaxID=546874 RepID=A0A1H2N8V3_9ACTN|nr:DUF3152 domain-containing protein [Microlunatus sagamiharensis]SDV01525.1 Protein of unknown function [Microlunatus sagamiharensis]